MSDHPPLANRRLMVDFDGTIIPWGPLMQLREPFAGVRGAMELAHRMGYAIGIFTSRLSQSWLDHAKAIGLDGVGQAYPPETFTVEAQESFIRQVLDRAKIPYDFVTAEKLPAEAYFDDKAISVPHPGTLTGALIHFLNESARETA